MGELRWFRQLTSAGFGAYVGDWAYYPASRVDTFVNMFESGIRLTRRQRRRWDICNAFYDFHSARSRRSRRRP